MGAYPVVHTLGHTDSEENKEEGERLIKVSRGILPREFSRVGCREEEGGCMRHRWIVQK